jgi:Sigma-70 region 3
VLPVHLIQIVNKLIRTSRQLVQVLGREPTSAEIAKQMDIPEAKGRKVVKIMRTPISLETPICERGRFSPQRPHRRPHRNLATLLQDFAAGPKAMKARAPSPFSAARRV